MLMVVVVLSLPVADGGEECGKLPEDLNEKRPERGGGEGKGLDEGGDSAVVVVVVVVVVSTRGSFIGAVVAGGGVGVDVLPPLLRLSSRR